ncbi:uncharacterized protein LOC144007799 [Festucalex cinctus]
MECGRLHLHQFRQRPANDRCLLHHQFRRRPASGRLRLVDAATEDESLGRLVNDDHINPNATMKYLNVQGKPHLCLFATRAFDSGEEITYNYGDSDWPWRSKESSQQNTLTSKLTVEKSISTSPTDALESFQECMMETRHSSMTVSQSDLNPAVEPQTSSEKHSDEERSAQPSEVDDIEQCMMETRHSSMTVSQSDPNPAVEPQTSSEKHSDAERSAQPSEVDIEQVHVV